MTVMSPWPAGRYPPKEGRCLLLTCMYLPHPSCPFAARHFLCRRVGLGRCCLLTGTRHRFSSPPQQSSTTTSIQYLCTRPSCILVQPNPTRFLVEQGTSQVVSISTGIYSSRFLRRNWRPFDPTSETRVLALALAEDPTDWVALDMGFICRAISMVSSQNAWAMELDLWKLPPLDPACHTRHVASRRLLSVLGVKPPLAASPSARSARLGSHQSAQALRPHWTPFPLQVWMALTGPVWFSSW